MKQQKTFSPTLAEDYVSSVFENMMLRKMLELRMEKATGKLRRVRNRSFRICTPHPM